MRKTSKANWKKRFRGAVQRGVYDKFCPSVMKLLSLRRQRQITTVKKNRQKKLLRLSERQDRPLGKQSEGSVKALDDIELSDWVQQVLVLGPKHPVRDKFNETHSLADIDICLSSISTIIKSLGRPFGEIEAVAKTYAKRVKQTPSDTVVEKARKYLKVNGLLAVPYDKGLVFVKEEGYLGEQVI